MEREEIPNLHSTQPATTNSDDKKQTTNPNTCISLNKYLEQLVWTFIPRSEVLQFHLYVVVLMPNLLNYITWSPWRPHKLLLPNYTPSPGPCKWQPPQSPFAPALVTDWYHYHGCLPHMHVAPLYKRASPPNPCLTFWLNLTSVTCRYRTWHLTRTLARLSLHLLHTR